MSTGIGIIDIRDKLRELHASVDGGLFVPDYYPGSLSTEQLPCVMSYPVQAQHRTAASPDLWRVDRQWVSRYYVWPAGHGEGVDEAYQRCYRFLELVPRTFHAPAVIVTTEWERLTLVRDSGIDANLTLHGARGGEMFTGITFFFEIVRKTPLGG